MKTPKNTGLDITQIINYQLAQILNLLKLDLEDGKITYNYLICENEIAFLDKDELGSYLNESRTINGLFLNGVKEKCEGIIKIWNEGFKNFPDRKFDFCYYDKKTGNTLKTILDFHAIYLTKNNWGFFGTPLEKENFVKEFDYTIYSIQSIAQRCSLILNWITAYDNVILPSE